MPYLFLKKIRLLAEAQESFKHGHLAAELTPGTFNSVNGEEMYLRLLAINAYEKVPLERVLAFENATVPLCLFCDNG